MSNTKTKTPPEMAEGPFWAVMIQFKALSDGCDDGDPFLTKNKPETLDAAWKHLVVGVERAAAKNRDDSAYVKAIKSWTHWILSQLEGNDDNYEDEDDDSPHPKGVVCPKCHNDKCESCGHAITRADSSLGGLVEFLKKFPNPPFTEEQIRKHVAEKYDHHHDPLAHEDQLLKKASSRSRRKS